MTAGRGDLDEQVVAARHEPEARRNRARAKSASTTRVPGRPSSSPMIAKMKSLCASGSQDHFSRLAPRPTPHQPPSASAYLPWTAWQARAELVGADAAQPGADPRHAAVAGHDQHRRPAPR